MTDTGISRAFRLFRSEGTGRTMRGWRVSAWLSGLSILVLIPLGLLVLDWWLGAHARLIEAAPRVRVMDQLGIMLTENRPVRIGRDQLGQAYVRGSVATGSAAAVEHVEFTLRVPDRADPTKDRIEIRNVATERRLWLDFANGFQTFAERFEIPNGNVADTRFVLPKGATITLRKVSREGFELSTKRGGGSSAKGSVCPPAAGPFHYRPEPWWGWLWRTFTLELPAGAADRDLVAAHIGGQSTDEQARPMQICLEAALDWDQLRLVYRGDRLFLAIGRDLDRAHYPITKELLAPGTDRVLDKNHNIYGFSQIAWTIAPRASVRERSAMQRVRDFAFGSQLDGEQVLRSFVAGRTSYALQFLPRSTATGRAPVQRQVEITPERKVMFQSVSECVGTPPPEGCPNPIVELRSDVGGLLCGTTDDGVFRQCWRETTPVAGSGSVALARPNPGGFPPIATGPAAGLIEIAVTKWVVLLFAAILAFAFRPRGPSDWFFEGGKRHGFMRALRSAPTRWAFVSISIGLALLPEAIAIAGSYFGGPGILRQGLSSNAAMICLTVNWGLSGLALILFTPKGAISVGIAWLAVTLLAAIGSLTLFSLAIDGPSTHWMGFFLKHKYLFLDSIPPIMTATAVASRVRVQRAIRAVLLDRGVGVALARISAPLLLAIFFALWLAAGSQTGVAGFQPIEAGKFVAVILMAAVLVGLVGYAEDVRLRLAFWERALSFLAFGSFAGLLIFAPIWRRDFSPVLIVLLLGTTVGSIYLFFASLNVLRAAAQRRDARMRIPLAFRPLVHRGVFFRSRIWPLGLRRRFGFVGLPLFAFVIMGFLGTAVVLSPRLYDYAVRMLLHVAEWRDETLSGRIETITQSMGQGRHVPAQRFITWYDLDYSAITPQRPPRAQFRDLEFHVIRSRTEVAYGDCGETRALDPRSRWWGRWINPTIEATVSTIADATIGQAALRSLCGPFEPKVSKPDSETDEVAPGGRELTDSIAPIEIPVAENDFTAAYMLARFGVGLAAMLYGGQVLLVLAVLYGLVRIHLGVQIGAPDAHLRQFLGVMLAGSMTLLVLQWTLSWSNVLGLLPVMGQPMTWVSAGNSHHFFMALPCLLVILFALRLAGHVPSPPRIRLPPHHASRE